MILVFFLVQAQRQQQQGGDGYNQSHEMADLQSPDHISPVQQPGNGHGVGGYAPPPPSNANQDPMAQFYDEVRTCFRFLWFYSAKIDLDLVFDDCTRLPPSKMTFPRTTPMSNVSESCSLVRLIAQTNNPTGRPPPSWMTWSCRPGTWETRSSRGYRISR